MADRPLFKLLEPFDLPPFWIPSKEMSAQSTGAVEYTNCISAERWDFPNECPVYDTKQSDGEASVMLKLWGMLSTLSLPSIPRSLWPGVVFSVSVLSMSQMELFAI